MNTLFVLGDGKQEDPTACSGRVCQYDIKKWGPDEKEVEIKFHIKFDGFSPQPSSRMIQVDRGFYQEVKDDIPNPISLQVAKSKMPDGNVHELCDVVQSCVKGDQPVWKYDPKSARWHGVNGSLYLSTPFSMDIPASSPVEVHFDNLDYQGGGSFSLTVSNAEDMKCDAKLNKCAWKNQKAIPMGTIQQLDFTMAWSHARKQCDDCQMSDPNVMSVKVWSIGICQDIH